MTNIISMTKMSDQIDEFAKAFCNFQSVVGNPKKSKSAGKGDFKYTYADIVDYLDIARQPLAENGFSFSQPPEININGEQYLCTIILHNSGQWLESTINLTEFIRQSKAQNILQGTGSIISYMRRYALASTLGLAQEDDDGDTGGIKKDTTHKPNPDDGDTGGIKKDTTHKPNPIEERKKLARQVAHLCLEHEIDPKSFGDFHKLSEQGVAGLTRVIENFDGFVMKFMSFAEGEDE